VDAALGLVDSIDVLSPFDDDGAVFLYHRLLSCGLRLAATAGTDTFLSFSHGPGVASNPPGWCRVSADLAGTPLSFESFKDGVRNGRTVVTNGPWLALEVDGAGPGAVIASPAGRPVTVTARATGEGTVRLSIIGPDGVLAETTDDQLQVAVDVTASTWIAATALEAGTGRRLLDRVARAHTTPVYVDVADARVARADDALWSLALIDGLENLIREHAALSPETRDERRRDYGQLLDEARDYYRGVLTSAKSRGH
jgi:hypothetical protein